MDNPHELDLSVERRIAGQHRLNIVRMDAYMGADGTPMVRMHTGSGSSACLAHGIKLDLLQAACSAFNVVLLTGEPLPDPLAPTVAWIGDGGELRDATDIRRRTALATGMPQAGDRVRADEDKAALSLV